MKLRVGNGGTALEAMRVKLVPLFEPSSTKLEGSRSGESSALMSVSPRTGPLPYGVIVSPAFSLSKLRYLLVTMLSIALDEPWPAGELVDVPFTKSSGMEASIME